MERFGPGFFMMFFLVLASPAVSGERCEVVGFSTYEGLGLELQGGFYFQVVEKCALVTIRNTDFRARWATDFDVTATFGNGEERRRPVRGEKDRLVKLEPGAEHETALCFGSSEHEITGADCDYP